MTTHIKTEHKANVSLQTLQKVNAKEKFQTICIALH